MSDSGNSGPDSDPDRENFLHTRRENFWHTPRENFRTPDRRPEKFVLGVSESYSDAGPVYLSEVTKFYFWRQKF